MTLSLYYRIEIKRSHLSASRTEYILGRSSRSESSISGRFDDRVLPTGKPIERSPLRSCIYNSDLGCCFGLDLESDDLLPRKTHVHTQTIDMGDRWENLGRTACRVLKRVTLTSADSAIGPGVIEIDTWHIDPPAAWQRFRNPGRLALHRIVPQLASRPLWKARLKPVSKWLHGKILKHIYGC
jgi:hypothetical protein